MKPIYIVTGACGHLGSTVVQKLSTRGARVRALVLPGQLAEAKRRYPGVELFAGDVLDPGTLEPLFTHSGRERLVVIHTAALISIAARVSQKLRAVNVDGVKNVINACLAHPPARLVHVSSVHALPTPPGRGVIRESDQYHPQWVHGAYAKTKAEGAQAVVEAVRHRGLDGVILLPTGILGPGDHGHNHLNHTIRDIITGRLTALVKGGYDLVDVRDVAEACLSAATRGHAGESYILSNRHYEWREVAETLVSCGEGGKVRAYFSPTALIPVAPLLELGAKLTGSQPLFTAYSMSCMRVNDNFSSGKARSELQFATRPIEVTLRDTARWERDRLPVTSAAYPAGKYASHGAGSSGARRSRTCPRPSPAV